MFSTDSRGRRVFIELEDEVAPPSVVAAVRPLCLFEMAALTLLFAGVSEWAEQDHQSGGAEGPGGEGRGIPALQTQPNGNGCARRRRRC